MSDFLFLFKQTYTPTDIWMPCQRPWVSVALLVPGWAPLPTYPP